MHAGVYRLHYAYKQDKAIRDAEFEENMKIKYGVWIDFNCLSNLT